MPTGKKQPIVTLKEKANEELIARLIGSPDISEEQRIILEKYRKKVTGGYVYVNYYYSKFCGNFGRLYAEGGLSLQNFKKCIRHSLAKDTYVDIDIVNAHPVLLAQYCQKNNIKCEFLNDYVNNREQWLQEIMNFHGISRDDAKKLILKLCYLGNYEISRKNINASSFISRCCVCHNYVSVDNFWDFFEIKSCVFDDKSIRLCQKCFTQAKMRQLKYFETHDHDANDELMYVEFLIDMYMEYHNVEVDESTNLNSLDSLLDIFFENNEVDHNKKLDKVISFAKELKKIANSISKLEKDISNIVEKNNDKINKKSSIMSLLAQVLENDCLTKMNKFFQMKEYIIGVLCFDGLMIEKDKVYTIDENLLEKCSKYVEKKTSYKIKLEIKEMNMGIKVPEISVYVEDDIDVRNKLFALENPNNFRFSNDALYIFDEETGKFKDNVHILYRYLEKHQQYLKKEVVVNNKKSIFKNYGRDITLMRRMPDIIKNVSIDESWIDRTADTSLYHLLFKNGIYNMKTNKFTKGFNPSIVFHERIDHDFPERNEDDIKYAADITVNLMLDDPKPLIVAFARALTGDVSEMKNFIFCPGKTNAGKSKLIKAIETCFGSYIGTFFIDNLSKKNKYDTKDEGAKFRWAYLLRFKRIIFSSEADMGNIISGGQIKKIASGGDGLVGRFHGGDETTFVPHFIPFCMLNDIPEIKPFDDAVYDRLLYCEFNKQFVENPTEDHHVKANPHINKIFKTQRFINGFTHLILDAYQYFLKHGQPEFDLKTKDEWTIEGRQDTSIVEILHNNFEITNNDNDFLTVSEMKKFRKCHKTEFSTISNKRFNEIFFLAFKIHQIRKGKNKVYGWPNICSKTQDD